MKIVSFNIRCLGCNGEYKGKLGTESRQKFLRNFLEGYFLDVDLFILQEVMDLSVLDQIFGESFTFKTYPHEYKRHMHVVFVFRNNLKIKDAGVIDGVALDSQKSRPAYYARFVKAPFDSQRTQESVHVVGVHLKSGYQHSMKRCKQAEAIVSFIKKNRKEKEPVVIAGDFNSHVKAHTHKEQDDLCYLDQIFSELELERPKCALPTYHTPYEQESLDHFWVAQNTADSFEVYDIWSYGSCEKPIQRFFNEISDHVPISLVLK